MYDVIGDIHGHADELVELLEELDYESHGGIYQHAERTAVFVGDFIDRGPQISAVLAIVRAMHSAGSALAVMGNHEFNALAYHTPHPTAAGQFLREHSEKNTRQHSQTLKQVPARELLDHLDWFRSLPMWLELDGIRVVHACWDQKQMAVIDSARREYGGVTAQFLTEANTSGTPLFSAIEDVLKGKEIDLPDGISYVDKDGHERQTMRIKWFRAPHNDTIASYALTAEPSLPSDPLSPGLPSDLSPYPADACPVFFGHYWLRSEHPEPLGSNIACVDYSVAKGGDLCAYRWMGECQLSREQFVCVPSQATHD